MDGRSLRFEFAKGVSMDDVEETLRLALLAVESEHGESAVRLEAGCSVDHWGRSCVIDAGTVVGAALARVFFGFVVREFGRDAVRTVVTSADAAAAQQSHRRAAFKATGSERAGWNRSAS
jgi:hypothetical protein